MANDKPVTAQELKTFIEAVEFAADQEDWVPSERQWRRIRTMIDRLEDTPAPAPVVAPPAAPVQYAPARLAPPDPVMHHQMSPGLSAQPTLSAAPLPVHASQLTGPFATGNAGPVRTPDIDTGHGKPYQSSFA